MVLFVSRLSCPHLRDIPTFETKKYIQILIFCPRALEFSLDTCEVPKRLSAWRHTTTTPNPSSLAKRHDILPMVWQDATPRLLRYGGADAEFNLFNLLFWRGGPPRAHHFVVVDRLPIGWFSPHKPNFEFFGSFPPCLCLVYFQKVFDFENSLTRSISWPLEMFRLVSSCPSRLFAVQPCPFLWEIFCCFQWGALSILQLWTIESPMQNSILPKYWMPISEHLAYTNATGSCIEPKTKLWSILGRIKACLVIKLYAIRVDFSCGLFWQQSWRLSHMHTLGNLDKMSSWLFVWV